jgi:FMN reductase
MIIRRATPTYSTHVAASQATVLGLCGNPRVGSRTLNVVDAASRAVAEAVGGCQLGSIDLVELGGELFQARAANVTRALEQVMQADILVVGSPVYKASYTGVLKAFCDHISAGQLSSKLAIPLMMGGSLQHFLALEVHLRPLLVELGAICPTPGLYVVETELDQLDAQLTAYVESIAPALALLSA